MSLAPYIRILGRGPGRSRSLTLEEAREAMQIMLSGDAAPEAVGALLMLMRYHGENAAEVAGFAEALDAALGPWRDLPVDLSWPSYSAGRTRLAPWFLLSARLVAASGRKVLLHGWNSHQSKGAAPRPALASLGIPFAETPEAVAQALDRNGIAYLPAETLHAPALRLLKLRDVLGLRSCLSTVFRMLNPGHAPAMVQGVFHPPYRNLQSDAAALLGQPQLGVVKGGGGEFERHPGKAVTLMGLRDGTGFETRLAPLINDTRRLHDPDIPTPGPDDLWSGAAQDEFATQCVIGTAAMALVTCGLTPTDAHEEATSLWADRHQALAA